MKESDENIKVKPDMCFENVKTRGRPMKKLTEAGKNIIKNLAAIMCTEEEIASVLETTVEVLHNRENGEAFSELMKNGKEEGKASLRRAQFKLAERNPSMAIWLGKQYLGQKDSTETEVNASAKEDAPVVQFIFKDTSMTEGK